MLALTESQHTKSRRFDCKTAVLMSLKKNTKGSKEIGGNIYKTKTKDTNSHENCLQYLIFFSSLHIEAGTAVLAILRITNINICSKFNVQKSKR